ncbi:response regulator transcription factor [Dongia sedimenti]|uniref:Response regulator transcription factor n=1 Tax=Dongia sedimenti TaxID=3064282 RepID=A0ABU0YS36_9PROT|nr:response regulator transcription factor [Rhodospirillaceae bacterium R-7]
MRILLVEDELDMAGALGAALSKHNIVIDHVSSVGDAREAVRLHAYDAILLDRQMPDGEGLRLIPEIRAADIDTPIIVLTAHNDHEGRIRGLDLGADDYMGKPFVVEELIARLRAVLRRQPLLSPDVITAGRLSFEVSHMEPSLDGKPVILPRRELLVLAALMKRIGRTVTREALANAVYNFDAEIQSNALDSHVSRLRKKLAELDAGVAIHTIRGIGYLLKAAE